MELKFEFLFLSLLIFGLVLISLVSIYFPTLWSVTSLLTLIIFLLIVLWLYERKVNRSKEIAVISIMGAFSAASRIPFAAVPSVQPCTFIVFVSGYVFGPFAGFFIGAETALLSNFFLGQGPWTPWQMLAWGVIGVVGWLFRRLFEGRRHEFLAGLMVIFLMGYFYGLIMNLWYWLAFIYPHTWQSFLMVLASSIWFDTLHAVGNVLFMDIFFTKFSGILQRYKFRFSLFNKTADSPVS
jgi:energy-coupling factor transport system substrate-specific component